MLADVLYVVEPVQSEIRRWFGAPSSLIRLSLDCASTRFDISVQASNVAHRLIPANNTEPANKPQIRSCGRYPSVGLALSEQMLSALCDSCNPALTAIACLSSQEFRRWFGTRSSGMAVRSLLVAYLH